MTLAQLQLAFDAHLRAAPGLDVKGYVYPNDALKEPVTPRLEISFHASQPRGALNETTQLEMRIVIVTEAYVSALPGLQLAQIIQDHFAPFQRIGAALIANTAHVPAGYKDGAEWRQPIIIRAATHHQI